jgi:hypothetical protein
MASRPCGLRILIMLAAAADALTFLHIPETAGSTLETLSMDWKKKRCGLREHGVVWRRACDWHTPPRDIHPRERLYPSQQTFCVIRDPLDRLLSEYKFEHRGSRDKLRDASMARRWIRYHAYHIARRRREDSALSARFPNRCHFLPQTWFLWDAAGTCTCHHVLRFEFLEEDFDALMMSQGLPTRLNQARNITHHLPSNLTRAAVADAATLEAVREAYSDDFALLPGVNGTCADLADYSEPYELTDRPRVCRGGKLG